MTAVVVVVVTAVVVVVTAVVVVVTAVVVVVVAPVVVVVVVVVVAYNEAVKPFENLTENVGEFVPVVVVVFLLLL